MNRLLLKVELLANVAIIVVALLLGVALFKNYRVGSSSGLYKSGAGDLTKQRRLGEVAGRLNLQLTAEQEDEVPGRLRAP